MGFRQSSITYIKQARLHGSSGWNLEKKLKLVVDSVTSFTYVPIRVMSYVGFVVALLGLLYAVFIVLHALRGSPPSGWSSLMVGVLLLGGVQMIMLGVLGHYSPQCRDRTILEHTHLSQGAVDPSSGGHLLGQHPPARLAVAAHLSCPLTPRLLAMLASARHRQHGQQLAAGPGW